MRSILLCPLPGGHFKKPLLVLFSVSLLGLNSLIPNASQANPIHGLIAPKLSPTEMLADADYTELRIASDLMEAGRYVQAIPHLRAAHEKDSTNIIALFNLGFCYLELAKRSTEPAQSATLLKQAELAFVRVYNINPMLNTTYFKLGKIALMQQDVDKAEQYYKLGLENDPGSAGLAFNLARVYDQKQEYDLAIKQYERTVALNPEFIYAYNNLGLMYEARKEFKQAEKAYKRALKANKTYNLPRMNLGNLYAQQNRMADAEKLYLEAIAIEPDNAWGYLYLGNLYFRQDRLQEANRAYAQSIAKNPDYANTYYLLAVTSTRLDRLDEALTAGLTYIRLDPTGEFASEMKSLILSVKLHQGGGLHLISNPGLTIDK